jgi:DNA repair protein RadA/Sms
MARARTTFRCTTCDASSPSWVGRCASCREWNTLVEEQASTATAAGSLEAGRPPAPAVPIGRVAVDRSGVVPTGISELDRVLGGGVVPGSATLLGGEPGIGKSTLALQVAAEMARASTRVLYASAEESTTQVRTRADRLGAVHDDLWLTTEAEVPALVALIDELSPELVVVDSIQTVRDPALASAAGSVGQVRECAASLVRLAKERGTALVLVGHVTKEGALAGPRVLEHLVDTVLAFEGDRHHALRLLRASKHRFGSTEDLGVFEMTSTGLVPVADPSALFLDDRRADVPGSVVVPVLDGYRPLLVEVQALATAAVPGQARRQANGLDAGRLSMVLAVLTERVGFDVAGRDVHALAVGGLRITEPAADVAVALAIASSLCDRAVPPGLVAVGEIGLGGELRQAHQTPRRLTEAARLGFTRAIVPRSAPEPPPGLDILRAATVGEAVALASLPLP